MKNKITLALVAAVATFGIGYADTPILDSPNFESLDDWNAGYNSFVGGSWVAFVTDAYTVDDRVNDAATAGMFTYDSFDDEESDVAEHYLYQEWGAGPAGSPTAVEIFEAGDVVVFKGSASAAVSGTDPSDVVVRAFIKMLGYNEFGWAFQVKPDYTVYFDLTSDMQDFELMVTFPDLEVDDSFQIIQVGFEITTKFDGAAMDYGEITLGNLEAFIVGDGTGGDDWFGYPVDENGWANAEGWLGWVNVTDDPWIISASFDKYLYIPGDQSGEGGAWVYNPKD